MSSLHVSGRVLRCHLLCLKFNSDLALSGSLKCMLDCCLNHCLFDCCVLLDTLLGKIMQNSLTQIYKNGLEMRDFDVIFVQQAHDTH